LHFVKEKDFKRIKKLFPCYCSLTWNHENALAGGANSSSGLKPFGREVISFLEESNIFLDTAHLNKKSFFAAAAVAKKPLICSHTCFDKLFCHPRNLDEQQILAIIESGGIIGLTFVPAFMGKDRGEISDIVRQIDYFAAKFGVERLAIGTDLFGTDYPIIETYKGFSALKECLKKSGYTPAQIKQIFFQNAQSFFEKNALHNKHS
jgi:membrane dipeptidase